jgi:hypothetical protein
MAKGQLKGFAQRTYGVTNGAADRTSPDCSGSPQQVDAISFCTSVGLKYQGGQVISLPFARTTSEKPAAVA